MFLKTHKAGSSTITNILFRYGESHGLNFAFPSGQSHFQYPWPFHRRAVSDYTPGSCYNIIASHMRFHGDELRGLLPVDRVYFTILRHPASLFESSFHYYGPSVPLTWRIPGPDKMAAFLRNPWAYYRPEAYNSHYLRNLQAFDLGYDKDMDPHESQLQQILQ
ncbi:galactosylceramide sulfotransferase-like, partial [Chiloscyllium plagiosum]|uniref:galactosylceramide sulfotransferase-like n=1 Tax=Chiloscyllium plagiosum TaxID=36176 RepID=UPI001CB85FBD